MTEGNGSKESPFRTIERAQETVRTMAENMQSDIEVNLMGGIYFLDKPVTMDERDSGRNGYKITWQSIPGEEAVISGGVEITGWEQHDGDIWKIKVPDKFIGRFISNVYIGEHVATFSRIEDQYFKGAIGDETNENGEAIKTATFSKDEIPYDAGMTDVMLFWDYNWRHYMWPVNGVTQDKNGDTVLKMIAGAPTYSINTMYTPPDWNFILSNAYAFMDRPGEFYYDRQNGEIYYYKEEGEDLTSYRTIIPYLEYLWRIEGETTENPVENISFKGITFSHSMCQRNYKYGMYVNQGLDGMQGRTEECINNVDVGMTNRGAVELLNARSISFENNTFTGLDNIGLAMYSGVYNSTIRGNMFKDISDTALCIGEPGADQYEKEKLYEMTDISVRKPITYSEPYTIWQDNIRLSKAGGNYVLMDLEENHSISKIYLKLETDMSVSDVIEIQASNVENFAAYGTVIKNLS